MKPDKTKSEHSTWQPPKGHIKEQPEISLIIPYRGGNPHRDAAFRWDLKYYEHALPGVEIVIGHSRDKIFCKTQAFNDAIRKSHGKVLVLMDADAYIDSKVITKCADKILENAEDHLWFVPYRHLYRLSETKSKEILDSNPKYPLTLTEPIPKEWIDGEQTKSSYGHRYGAMMMIIPREAYDTLGCFDERFKGWGGEDVALLRALDTLYGKHKTTKNPIFHLWHPTRGTNYLNRTWKGQARFNPNGNLAMRYHKASRNPSQMRKLVNEGCESSQPFYRIKKKLEAILNVIKKVLRYLFGLRGGKGHDIYR